jgi:hypothetical protein
MSDTAIIALIVGVVTIFIGGLTSLLVFAFKLGVSSAKVTRLETDMASINAKLSEIYNMMSQAVPHRCDKVEFLTQLKAQLTEHEHRMDRIQGEK